jgi:transposase
MQITTIGLDIAKNVFQAHGIDRNEKVVARKQLRRGHVIRFFQSLSPCLLALRPVPQLTIGRVNSRYARSVASRVDFTLGSGSRGQQTSF